MVRKEPERWFVPDEKTEMTFEELKWKYKGKYSEKDRAIHAPRRQYSPL